MPTQDANPSNAPGTMTDSGLQMNSAGIIMASSSGFGSPENRKSSLESAAKHGSLSPDSKRRLF